MEEDECFRLEKQSLGKHKSERDVGPEERVTNPGEREASVLA
jgi:hypothetical protein